jgi:hypothetical protein
MFDYSVLDKTLLSEERTVKSHSQLCARLAELVTLIDSPVFWKGLISGIIAGTASFEAGFLYYVPKSFLARVVTAVRQAWVELFGEQAIIASDDRLLDEDARNKGYEVKSIAQDSLKKLLIAFRIPQSSDVVTRTPEITEIAFEGLSKEEQAVFTLANTLLLVFYPDDNKLYPVHFFESLNPNVNWHGFAGANDRRYKEKWISRLALSSGPMHVLLTLVHERRHCVSKAQDYTAAFEHQADLDQTSMMALHGPRSLTFPIAQKQKEFQKK